uniref:C-type lectin domain-containing protein n=1 Tax=Ascaris lumbricoides TaxID=6252 RepID=A0A0M3I5R0_ASCLU
MSKKIFAYGNGTIKYANYDIFSFNANQSCEKCTLQHKVWIPNIVFQKFVEAASNPSMKAAQAALSSQTPFLEVSIGDMFFRGYKDPFLDKVCSIPFMNFICEAVLDLPEKIAFLAELNNTWNDIFQVSTGEMDGGVTLGQIESWNGEKYVPDSWWADEFSTSIYFVFDKEVEYRGVNAYRFIVSPDLFDWNQPENGAFCFNSGKEFFKKDEQCLPRGLIDISRCRRGEPPVVLSLPNFLYADDIVKDSIIGLNESSPEHDGIAITLEPSNRVMNFFEMRQRRTIRSTIAPSQIEKPYSMNNLNHTMD